MDKLTAKDRLELFYFLYKEWGITATSEIYNAIINAIENREQLPILIKEKDL